jgi:hypothetical protein
MGLPWHRFSSSFDGDPDVFELRERHGRERAKILKDTFRGAVSYAVLYATDGVIHPSALPLFDATPDEMDDLCVGFKREDGHDTDSWLIMRKSGWQIRNFSRYQQTTETHAIRQAQAAKGAEVANAKKACAKAGHDVKCRCWDGSGATKK